MNHNRLVLLCAIVALTLPMVLGRTLSSWFSHPKNDDERLAKLNNNKLELKEIRSTLSSFDDKDKEICGITVTNLLKSGEETDCESPDVHVRTKKLMKCSLNLAVNVYLISYPGKYKRKDCVALIEEAYHNYEKVKEIYDDKNKLSVEEVEEKLNSISQKSNIEFHENLSVKAVLYQATYEVRKEADCSSEILSACRKNIAYFEKVQNMHNYLESRFKELEEKCKKYAPTLVGSLAKGCSGFASACFKTLGTVQGASRGAAEVAATYVGEKIFGNPEDNKPDTLWNPYALAR